MILRALILHKTIYSNITVFLFKNAKKGIHRGEEKCVRAKATTVANPQWIFPFRHRDIDRKRKKV